MATNWSADAFIKANSKVNDKWIGSNMLKAFAKADEEGNQDLKVSVKELYDFQEKRGMNLSDLQKHLHTHFGSLDLLGQWS